MVKSNKQPRPMPATDRSSTNASGSGNYMENTYCVVLHVVEAINFYGREMREGEREQIIMNAALNTVDFEVEGTPSATSETIIFNSNCIWECDMAGIKRIKTDHRPVKVTFYASGGIERKTIGSLLLPVRGLPVLGTGGNNSPQQLKMFWHKLICISNEFRSHKPEVLLMLAIIKKSLLHTKDFKHLTAFNCSEKQSPTPPLQSPGHSITANMLQSQANVYVQSLVQLGLLQVGNDPLVDCDIIEVVLQFKQLKNVRKFVRSVYQGKLDDVETVLVMFDFVGNVTNIELKLNHADIYTLNDVLGLRFKSSLRSIRLYFQRIFYLPINMYVNGSSIANYRMDFGKLLPPDTYFADNRKFVHTGCFAFDRFSRMGSAREVKPIMDFTFTVDIQEVYWSQQEKLEEPSLKQQERHEDSLDMQSVGTKAVILEVPKDRVFDNGVEWTRNSEMQSVSGNGSVDSLNVGAELSESDEREIPLESSSKKPKKKKLGRTSRSIIRKNIEYSEMNVSSEMESNIDSSLMNESFKEYMPKRKVSTRECSNIHSSQDIIVSEMNLKIENNTESSFVEQLKLERKLIKKNNDCDKSQDPIANPVTNPIAKQSTPNTSKLRERIRHKTENVASELESSPTRKFEKKPRQTVHRSALHKYLDAEEACATSQQVADQSEKPLKKRTVRATAFEPWEAEALELQSIGSKGVSKKRTAKVPSDVNQLQQTVIDKLCALKEKNSAPSQLGAAAPVSHLEVTVHMYDDKKVAEERARDGTTYVNQSVNTDITNMNESIKLILATGRKLQDEMQRKTQEYMDSLSQYRSEADSSQRTSNNETPKSIHNMTNIGADYESKFVELEQHIGELEQHLRKFESRTQDMQDMNSKLENEKIQLKQRINKMELQIEQLRQQGTSGNNLQEVLSEMRLQNMRYMDMSKAKDRYKKQWRRSAKRVHALKLAMYEKRMESEKNLPQMLNLKSILTKDADEFEREFGRFRRSNTALSFSGSGDSPEPLLKDYLRGLSSQAVDQHKPVNHVESSRMH
ncbi:hypothetical protein AWZ03_004741 [Drosophila navojoa]|uniref:DUF3668 domain-containing protein n=1 Tax=Drosophila navojoa TaxID=7232 RepID=A0A484BJB8_DRONA|nr:hypothetical protein AWZ03_004741 [Drosophila navojoa]